MMYEASLLPPYLGGQHVNNKLSSADSMRTKGAACLTLGCTEEGDLLPGENNTSGRKDGQTESWKMTAELPCGLKKREG